MERRVFGFALLLVVLGAVSANAQSSKMLVSDIPFSFIVGDEVLPGGEYSIQAFNLNDRLLQLRDWKGHSLYIPISKSSKATADAKDKLVFHQVNGQYFLVSIWTADDSLGRVLPASRREREILAQGGQPVVKELKASAR